MLKYFLLRAIGEERIKERSLMPEWENKTLALVQRGNGDCYSFTLDELKEAVEDTNGLVAAFYLNGEKIAPPDLPFFVPILPTAKP